MSNAFKNISSVEEYKFQDFKVLNEKMNGGSSSILSSDDESVTDFVFQPLSQKSRELKTPEFQREIKLERTLAKASKFKINPIVEEHRGIKEQENQETEIIIKRRVESAIAKIENEAFKKGFEQGV